MRDAATTSAKRPTLFEGVGVALMASVFAGAVSFALLAFFPPALVLRGVTSALTLAYVVYLLVRSPDRVGRVSVIALWVALSAAIALLDPPLMLYVAIHLGLVWLIRSLYFYSSVLSSLADLGLTGLGLAVAVWAAAQTGSVFMTVWCLFLVQALFCVIPPDLRHTPVRRVAGIHTDDRFDRAHRSAEAAVRKLSTAL